MNESALGGEGGGEASRKGPDLDSHWTICDGDGLYPMCCNVSVDWGKCHTFLHFYTGLTLTLLQLHNVTYTCKYIQIQPVIQQPF